MQRGKSGVSIRQLMPLIVVAAVLFVGTIILASSRAAGPFVAAEPEQGSIASPAAAVADTTASGGSGVRFSQQSSSACAKPGPLHTPDGPDGMGGCWPGPSTTGVPAGTALTRVPSQATSGPGWGWWSNAVHVTTDNVTVQNLDIDGTLVVDADGVTVKNMRVRCINEDYWCAEFHGNGSTLSDTEIGGGANSTTFNSNNALVAGGPNVTLRRLNLHHTTDGLKNQSGVAMYDNYIHDLRIGGHADGSQTESDQGFYPMIFHHNTIMGGENDALFFQAVHDTLTITNNFFIAYDNQAENLQSSYGVGGGGCTSGGGPITVNNNVFTNGWQIAAIQTGSWSPCTLTQSGNTTLAYGSVSYPSTP